VKAPRPLILAVVLTATAAIGFGFGTITTAPASAAGAGHRYTLRMGDRVTIPAVRQRCAVYKEGGVPGLLCARPRGERHQVILFPDRIQVWKTGNPDAPVWSGRP
jgi:hypothetical protein